MSNNTPFFPPQLPHDLPSPPQKSFKTSNYNLYSRFFIIAIVVLSLVVAMVVLLHMYLRYARRRHLSQYRRQTVNLLRLATFPNNTSMPRSETPKGLDPGALSSIKSFQYRSRSENDEASDGSVKEDCAVCLSFLEEGDVVRMLPGCRHVFHVVCIDKWLVASASCPVCRAEVSPREPSVSVQVNGAVTEELVESKEVEAEASVSARVSSSFRRMLSLERSSRRVHGDGALVGDLERGIEVNTS